MNYNPIKRFFARFLLIFGAQLLAVSVSWGSTLSDLASSLQPGQFVEVPTNGINVSGLLANPAASADYIFQYSDKMVWDSTNKRLLFAGAAHGLERWGNMVEYDAASNTWTALGDPEDLVGVVNGFVASPAVGLTFSARTGINVLVTTSVPYFTAANVQQFILNNSCRGNCGKAYIASYVDSTHIRVNIRDDFPNTDTNGVAAGHWSLYSAANKPWGFIHAYEHNAIDPSRGYFYYRHYLGGMFRYNLATGVWSAVPDPSSSVIRWMGTCCGAIEYFPEMDGIFVVMGGQQQVALYKESAGWTALPSTNAMGGYSNIARYHPLLHKMLYGGGWNSDGTYDTHLYLMDSSQNITSLDPAPCRIGPLKSVVVADPTSSTFLVFCTNNDSSLSHYELDPTKAAGTQWTQKTAPAFFSAYEPPVSGFTAVALSEYGVTAFLDYKPTGSHLWIYKRGSGAGTTVKSSLPPPSDTTPPSVPTGLAATAISSSQINLSWGASTDNVAVAGYNVLRNGSLIASVPGTSYQDTGLSSSSPYSYTVTAYDASANTSAQSASASATTQSATVTPPPSGGSDFLTRCAASGVLRCVGFDNASDIAGVYGNNHGIMPGSCSPNTGCTNGPVLDTSVKASGNSSLRFTIPSLSDPGASGAYFINFSDDLFTQFGDNSDFYVQYRERFDSNFLATYFLNGGGWKQNIIGAGDKPTCDPAHPNSTDCPTSCTPLEIVLQNTSQRGFPQMYNSCTGAFWFPTASVSPGATTGPGVTFYSNVPQFTADYVGWQINQATSAPVATLYLSATTGSGVTFTSSAPVFTQSNIGWLINNHGTLVGKAIITTVLDSQTVVAKITQDFPNTNPITSGNWTLGATGAATITSVIDSQHAVANITSPFTTTNAMDRGFYSISATGAYKPFQELYGGSDYKLQNARLSPYCLYSQRLTSFFPPTGNCLPYVANEWMTFKVHIHVGIRAVDASGNPLNVWKNSHVDAWAAREGQPSEQIFNWGPHDLVAGPPSANLKYGKVWLLPYHTNKDHNQVTPTMNVWYDELIISTQDIADPGSTTTPKLPPGAPSNLTLR